MGDVDAENTNMTFLVVDKTSRSTCSNIVVMRIRCRVSAKDNIIPIRNFREVTLLI